jgi:AcrR family transcriptional regulator
LVARPVHLASTLARIAAERQASERSEAVRQLKRDLILDAAQEVFEAKGLDGPRAAIAARAGYTRRFYFHFCSKEATYAAVLQDSLANLGLDP